MRTTLMILSCLVVCSCGGKDGGESTTPESPADSSAVTDAASAAPDVAAADPLAGATPEWLSRGAKVYEESCAMCHGDSAQGKGSKNPALKGDGALSRFASNVELLKYTKETMPKNDPGTLSEADYLAVLAWLRSGS